MTDIDMGNGYRYTCRKVTAGVLACSIQEKETNNTVVHSQVRATPSIKAINSEYLENPKP